MSYEEYPPDHYKPLWSLATPAYIVDIDGTAADHSESGRGHYEYERVNEDEPIPDVIRVIEALSTGYEIIFVSGREESCREQTETWIKAHMLIDAFDLHMRKIGDRRPDTIVKRELFDRYIRNDKMMRIVGVFDDRNRVVKMWREQLGLTVFHVADHGF
jgi:hypothetical protein